MLTLSIAIDHTCLQGAESNLEDLPRGASDALAGMTLVISGLTRFERGALADLVVRHGGRVRKAVSGATTHLLAGREAGPVKLQRAAKVGAHVISEEALLDFVRASADPGAASRGRQPELEAAEFEAARGAPPDRDVK